MSYSHEKTEEYIMSDFSASRARTETGPEDVAKRDMTQVEVYASRLLELEGEMLNAVHRREERKKDLEVAGRNFEAADRAVLELGRERNALLKALSKFQLPEYEPEDEDK